MINPDLIQQFTEKLEERNAEDFLQVLCNEFDGFFGAYLTRKQMLKDQMCDDPECPHCNPEQEFPDEIG